MLRHSLPVGIFASACIMLAGATGAQAAIETWVSTNGSDAGTCPITAPCRTFAFAHGQTSNNGAINVLSSGNFGPLTITKPISIVADGVEAVINTGAGGAGIIVQVGATAVVSLRGLTIDMRGTANIGISFVSGAALHIQDSVIRKANDGIRFAPASGTSELFVADTTVADSTLFSINVNPAGSANARVVLDRVRVENGGGSGMNFEDNATTGAVTATVRDSISSGNINPGIAAFTGFGSNGQVRVMVDRSAFVNNLTGVSAHGANATIRIGNSTVTGNQNGLVSVLSGAILSYGTNKMDGNDTEGNPTGSVNPR